MITEQWAIQLMADTRVELSEFDLKILRFGPQPWLPHEVLRYNFLKMKYKED